MRARQLENEKNKKIRDEERSTFSGRPEGGRGVAMMGGQAGWGGVRLEGERERGREGREISPARKRPRRRSLEFTTLAIAAASASDIAAAEDLHSVSI